ncbi:hypothetical protein ABZP36_013171 [Zizania latifolia]
MDGRKKQVVDAAVVSGGEGEREGRQFKARKDYLIVATQFWPLMDKIDAWLEQHRAPQSPQEEALTSDVEDEEEEEAPAPADRREGLADTIRRLLRDLDGAGGGSSTGVAGEACAAAAGGRHEEA